MVREDPNDPLKEGGRSPVSLRRRLRFGLIVAEVALTSLMLVGAGLTLRSFQQVLSQDPGIDTAGRLTFSVSLPRLRYPDGAASTRFFTELDSRLAGETLVRKVGATNNLPLTASDGRRGVVIEDREVGPDDGPTRAHPRSVTSNYLQAIGARIKEGRGLLPSDVEASAKVAVVNETMARRYWPNQSAIGGRVRFTDQENNWREVVGVVQDVKHWGLDAVVNPEMYLPAAQHPSGLMSFVIATDADPIALVSAVQRHVRELDANLPLFQVRTLEDVASRSVERRRFTMVLLACFAVLALVLAAAGIYGVMAHLVSLRTPEIGIRLTLGARPSSVMRQILGEALAQAGIGLALGLGASLALMKGLRAILYGIEPTDRAHACRRGRHAAGSGDVSGRHASISRDADRSRRGPACGVNASHGNVETRKHRIGFFKMHVEKESSVLQCFCASVRRTLRLFLDREAVEEPGPAGADQVVLAAALARMRRVPGPVAAALLVVVPQLRGPRTVARPVVAGVVGAVGVGAAVGGRTGENVVLVRLVADAVDQFALFIQRELFAQRVADARLLDRVAVQHAVVHRNDLAAEVVPRAGADAVARVDRAGPLRAQVGAPHRIALSRGLRERLAMRIRAGQPAEIGAVALADARDKERHRLPRRRRAG